MQKVNIFNTRIGLIFAAVGAAVGLGNIWRFPYRLGESGGGAFLTVYILSVLLISVPLLILELWIGKNSKNPKNQDTVLIFQEHAPNTAWPVLGFTHVITCVLTMAVYVVIGGWILYYMLHSFNMVEIIESSNYTVFYDKFIADNWTPNFFMLIFLLLNTLVICLGVTQGIEKSCLVIMPFLFLSILFLVGYSLFLPNTSQALSFIFMPRWNELNPSLIMSAFSQALFSTSIGFGNILLYGKYAPKNLNVGRTGVLVAITDTIVAVLAAILIFNIVFAFNIKPDAGPSLIFISLPTIFSQILFGEWLFLLFLFLIFAAAFTSSISMLEPIVVYLMRKLNISRVKGTWLSSLLLLFLGVLSSLAYNKSNNLFYTGTWLQLGAVLICIVVFIILSYKLIVSYFHNTLKLGYVQSKNITIMANICFAILAVAFFYYFRHQNIYNIFSEIVDKFTLPFAAAGTALFVNFNLKRRDLAKEIKAKWLLNYVLFNTTYIIPLVIISLFIFGIWTSLIK